MNPNIRYLDCNNCGKRVSTGFIPLKIEGFREIIIRAWIECPECIENKIKANKIGEVNESK